MSIFESIFFAISAAVIIIFAYKELKRSAQYHRKWMMMMDEMHEYFARCNEKER